MQNKHAQRNTIETEQWVQNTVVLEAADFILVFLIFCLLHSLFLPFTCRQWRRQLWGIGARAPSTSKFESQLSKYCVVCEISWYRSQQLTALSISPALVTKLLVIEKLLHPASKSTVSAPWHNFNLCSSSQQILATPLHAGGNTPINKTAKHDIPLSPRFI